MNDLLNLYDESLNMKVSICVGLIITLLSPCQTQLKATKKDSQVN